MKALYRLLSLLGDVRAASRGPGSYVRRKVRSKAHKTLAKATRRNRWTKP